MHALGSEMLSRSLGVGPSLFLGVLKELSDERTKRMYPQNPTAGFSKADLLADIGGTLAGQLPLSIRAHGTMPMIGLPLRHALLGVGSQPYYGGGQPFPGYYPNIRDIPGAVPYPAGSPEQVGGEIHRMSGFDPFAYGAGEAQRRLFSQAPLTQTGYGTLEQLLGTGAPTDVSAITQAAQSQGRREYGDLSRQIAENMGALGLTGSSAQTAALARGAENVGTRIGEEGLRAGVGAAESATGRRLSALQPALGVSQGLTEQLRAAGQIGQTAAGQKAGATESAAQTGMQLGGRAGFGGFIPPNVGRGGQWGPGTIADQLLVEHRARGTSGTSRQRAQMLSRGDMPSGGMTDWERAHEGSDLLQQLMYQDPRLGGMLQAHSDLGAANPAALGGFADYVRQMSRPGMREMAMRAVPGALPSGGSALAAQRMLPYAMGFEAMHAGLSPEDIGQVSQALQAGQETDYQTSPVGRAVRRRAKGTPSRKPKQDFEVMGVGGPELIMVGDGNGPELVNIRPAEETRHFIPEHLQMLDHMLRMRERHAAMGVPARTMGAAMSAGDSMMPPFSSATAQWPSVSLPSHGQFKGGPTIPASPDIPRRAETGVPQATWAQSGIPLGGGPGYFDDAGDVGGEEDALPFGQRLGASARATSELLRNLYAGFPMLGRYLTERFISGPAEQFRRGYEGPEATQKRLVRSAAEKLKPAGAKARAESQKALAKPSRIPEEVGEPAGLAEATEGEIPGGFAPQAPVDPDIEALKHTQRMESLARSALILDPVGSPEKQARLLNIYATYADAAQRAQGVIQQKAETALKTRQVETGAEIAQAQLENAVRARVAMEAASNRAGAMEAQRLLKAMQSNPAINQLIMAYSRLGNLKGEMGEQGKALIRGLLAQQGVQFRQPGLLERILSGFSAQPEFVPLTGARVQNQMNQIDPEDLQSLYGAVGGE